MYYIVDTFDRFYAGKCDSDKRTPVWKGHWTRALSFDTIESAVEKAKEDNIFYLGVEYIMEES